jgi:hypothetical protein
MRLVSLCNARKRTVSVRKRPGKYEINYFDGFDESLLMLLAMGEVAKSSGLLTSPPTTMWPPPLPPAIGLLDRLVAVVVAVNADAIAATLAWYDACGECDSECMFDEPTSPTTTPIGVAIDD